MTITLIVEDGTKPINANTYVSLEDADAYHTSLGNADWPIGTAEEEKKQALILATQSVDLLYGARYITTIHPDSQQVLLWPRLWFIDGNARVVKENTIPKCLKDAVCEIALKQMLGDDLMPLQSVVSMAKSNKVKVGDIETQVEYWKPAEGESYDGFRKIDVLLRPILKLANTASWKLKA